jgi:hypothetical protein
MPKLNGYSGGPPPRSSPKNIVLIAITGWGPKTTNGIRGSGRCPSLPVHPIALDNLSIRFNPQTGSALPLPTTPLTSQSEH